MHDLSEDEARCIAAFVEFLRRRKQEQTQRDSTQEDATQGIPPFAVWPFGVKGTLSREEIYDDL